ncbi:retrovirus-related pol polyprotein from transposon TNT 1-94 [Tanacetum coccineum]
MKEMVMPNNSQVMLKKKQVEDHHRISSCLNKTKSVITCNDSLYSRTSNAKAVCITCDKCVFNSNHDASVDKYINDANARTKKPKLVPISTRKPTKNANLSVAPPHKKTVASETAIQKSSTYFRMLYEETSKAWTWWIKKQCPPGYIWKPKGNDLLMGNRGSNLYTIALQESSTPTPICFMAKASPTQAWLWHRRLSHLNFDTISVLSKNDIVNGLPKLKYVKDQLCLSCEMGKAKRSNFKTTTVPSSKGQLHLLHMDLCGLMWLESINGKIYILFLNKTLQTYFKEEGISHQTTIAQTPGRNGVVERRNRTLVKAARTMLSASKLPLFFWAEAIVTAFRDGENLDKMKEKGDPCIFVGLRTNKHINEPSSSKPVPNDVLISDKTDTSLKELELLFSPMYEEYFNDGNKSVSKSSAHSDNLQQQDTQSTLNVQDKLELIIPPTDVNAEEINTNQAENAAFEAYEFINPFALPGIEAFESSLCNIDTSNMRTFYQRHHFDCHWTKDHPLKQVCGNPSKPVQTRRQLLL